MTLRRWKISNGSAIFSKRFETREQMIRLVDLVSDAEGVQIFHRCPKRAI